MPARLLKIDLGENPVPRHSEAGKDAEGFIDHVAVSAEVAQPIGFHGMIAQVCREPAAIAVALPAGSIRANAGQIVGWLVGLAVEQIGLVPHAVQKKVVKVGVALNKAVEGRDSGPRGEGSRAPAKQCPPGSP
jgi:hypothetical protein